MNMNISNSLCQLKELHFADVDPFKSNSNNGNTVKQNRFRRISAKFIHKKKSKSKLKSTKLCSDNAIPVSTKSITTDKLLWRTTLSTIYKDQFLLKILTEFMTESYN
eukprot:913649_1